MRIGLWVFVGIIVISTLPFYSCQDVTFSDDPEVMLRFSKDTVQFDTVFTTLGSATRILKVYNDNDEAIQIQNIRLADQNDGFFRLNIDGITSTTAKDLQILAGDSLYIFTEVTIDPDRDVTSSPFVIEDWVFFETNGNEQQVLLEAWGQNANYITSKTQAGGRSLLTCDMQSIRWDDPKPYIIYGLLFVDECELILPAGTEIYIHGGLSPVGQSFIPDGLLYFLKDGKLTSEGTVDDPVVIQGDRLESVFDDVEGQYYAVWFGPESRGNEMTHTVIKNAIIGAVVDSSAQLTLNSCEIRGSASEGLVGRHSSITAHNSLIHSTLGYGAALTYGGSYNFDYCTITNYSSQRSAVLLDNSICEGLLCEDRFDVNPLRANFRNCILFGGDSDEIELFDGTGGDDPLAFRYRFRNCVVAVDELLEEFPNFFDQCDDCVLGTSMDSLFVDHAIQNFQLDTMSIAENNAMPISNIPIDKLGRLRDPARPDIGCFEFQE